MDEFPTKQTQNIILVFETHEHTLIKINSNNFGLGIQYKRC